jgi:hypothetical protein
MNSLLVCIFLAANDVPPPEQSSVQSTVQPLAISTFALAPVFEIGGDFGGEPMLITLTTTGTKRMLEAGRGGHVGAGIMLGLTRYSPHIFEAQLTAGMKLSNAGGSNGKAYWWRFPLETLLFYRNTRLPFRIGGGLTTHFAESIRGNGVASGLRTDFATALGYIVQVDYVFGKASRMALGARFTGIRYRDRLSGEIFNGNSGGLVLSYALDVLNFNGL